MKKLILLLMLITVAVPAFAYDPFAASHKATEDAIKAAPKSKGWGMQGAGIEEIQKWNQERIKGEDAALRYVPTATEKAQMEADEKLIQEAKRAEQAKKAREESVYASRRPQGTAVSSGKIEYGYVNGELRPTSIGGRKVDYSYVNGELRPTSIGK